MAFVHLHVHTEYSALDGMIRMKELFGVAKDLGQDTVAVTDHGTLAGMWEAQVQAEKAGVKLAPGQEFYLANGSRNDKTAFMVPRDDNSADEDTERSEDEKFKDEGKGDYKPRPYQHLTILARNEAGWRNLVLLNNKAQESIWHKPRIDYSLIKEHSEGLIVLTGCLGGPVIGPISHAQRAEDEAETLAAQLEAHPGRDRIQEFRGVDEDVKIPDDVKAARTIADAIPRKRQFAQQSRQAVRDNIEALIDAVGRDNVYVEIMDHGIAEESVIIPQVVELAREYGLGIVATNDAHHTHEDDHHAHEAWLLVQSKSTIDKPKFQFHGSGFWLKSEDEMRAVRPEPWWQEACDTTQMIADRIEDRIIPGHRDLLPRFTTPEGYASNRDYIYKLLRDGAQRIYGGISKRVHDRIRTEMEVIEESGYIDYFLVVHDVISWCVSQGILVGPGRGSAGGSLVAYLLGITRVDPLRYGLLFERFLERGRAEPPDIDIDFPQSRRDDVIQYLRDRWGHDKVAFIGTFQLARTKAAIKDAARVLGQSVIGNKMAALVPMVEAKPMPVADLLNPKDPATAEYRKLVEKVGDDGETAPGRRIHDMAASFENIVKGVGIHASGIIVSAMPLFDLVPMRMTKRGWALQWTGPEAEKAGLLKVDVLGLRNLDIVSKTVEYIEQTTGERIDPLALPDPDVPLPADADRVTRAWQAISAGRTEGLFQLESPKMTELAMDVAPRSLNDLSALVALFRPGPMGKGLHTEYASRKRDPRLVSYRDYTTDPAEQAALATVLADTHGLMVYQEQAMMLGTVIAGFDAPGRSTLRKAISKKKADVMAEVGAKFLAGAPHEHRNAQGEVDSIPFTETTANVVWDAMVSFASYAFNRSHSATYGYLAYITAYLKGNWPTEFAAATLAVTSGKEKRLQVLRSLRREGVEVLAPDVNAGNAYTAPAGEGQIRIGLAEVKGLKEAGIRIAEVRQASGPFSGIGDLYARVQKPVGAGGVGAGSAISSAHVSSLIEAGAMDQWGPRLGLYSVAGVAKIVDVPAPSMEWGVLERASRQRDALGLLVGTHPLTALQDQVRNYQPFSTEHGWDARSSVTVVSIPKIPDVDGATVTTIGLLAEWSEGAYSRGRRVNILVEGSTASIGGTMWDSELTAHTEAGLIPSVGDIVAVTGRVRFRQIEADGDDDEAMPQTVKELGINRIRVVPVIDRALDEWPTDASMPVPNLTGGFDPFEREQLVIAQEGAPAVDEAPAPMQTSAPEQAPAPIEHELPADAAPQGIAPVVSLDAERAKREMGAPAAQADVEQTTRPQRVRGGAGLEGWLIEGVADVPSGEPAVSGQSPYLVVERIDEARELTPEEQHALVTAIASWRCDCDEAGVWHLQVRHVDGFRMYLTIGKSSRHAALVGA